MRCVAVTASRFASTTSMSPAELPEDLAAGAAGRRRRCGVGDDGDARELAMPFGERLEHRDALGADGQAVGGVLDVAAGDDRAVGGLERGADLEAASSRRRARSRAARARDATSAAQSRPMMPSSSAMNCPRTRCVVSITSS